jgi:hypothetical protein
MRAIMKDDVKQAVPCNLCGEPCGTEHSQGMVNQTVHGGYNSTPGNGTGALDDMTHYAFSLCEFCLDWLFTQFKTPPVVICRLSPPEDPPDQWRNASQRVNEDSWRSQKAAFFQEFARRNAARGHKP